jgi:twitching motility protein PilT
MYSSIQTGQKEGMVTLEQTLKEMVRRGSVTVDDARRKANKPLDL